MPDLDPILRHRVTNNPINASTGGGLDGQSREETTENLEAGEIVTGEEGLISLAAKSDLEDINNIHAEEVKEGKAETTSYMT